MINLYTQKESNIRKTWLLVTVSLVLVVAIGWIFSLYFNSSAILYAAIAVGLVTNLIAYWQSDKIALALSGAKPVSREQNPYLYRMIENLCITAGLPVPRVYIMASEQINAFATGRDPKHAAIAVTQGAINKLENEELEGVLAHEISHIGNRDILISTIVVVIAGVIATMADWFFRVNFLGGHRDNDRGNAGAVVAVLAIVAAILAPLAAMLIQMAVSRKREYLADATGSLLTRYPDGLANALEKISRDQSPMLMAKTATAHLFISNPLKGDKSGKASWFSRLFMTHPPISDRIRILRGMDISK